MRERSTRTLSFATALSVLLIAAPGTAQTECTLDTEAIRSYIDTRSPLVRRVISTSRSAKRSFAQVLELKTGTRVTFSVGGCAHVGISFTFHTGRSFTKATPLPELIRIAHSELKSVPVREQDQQMLADFREIFTSGAALEDAEPIPGGYLLACSDAICELTVPDPGALRLAYSFAL